MKLIVIVCLLIFFGCSTEPSSKDLVTQQKPHDPFVVYGIANNITLNIDAFLGGSQYYTDKNRAYTFVNLDLIMYKVEINTSNNTFEVSTYLNILQCDSNILTIEVLPNLDYITDVNFQIPFIGGDSVLLEYNTMSPPGSYINNANNIIVKMILTN